MAQVTLRTRKNGCQGIIYEHEYPYILQGRVWFFNRKLISKITVLSLILELNEKDKSRGVPPSDVRTE